MLTRLQHIKLSFCMTIRGMSVLTMFNVVLLFVNVLDVILARILTSIGYCGYACRSSEQRRADGSVGLLLMLFCDSRCPGT